jgi:hypothetical protein
MNGRAQLLGLLAGLVALAAAAAAVVIVILLLRDTIG